MQFKTIKRHKVTSKLVLLHQIAINKKAQKDCSFARIMSKLTIDSNLAKK